MAERSSSTMLAACLPSVATALCVGLQLLLSRSSFDGGRPMLITLLTALGIAAVAAPLWWTMGLRQARLGIRLTLAIPLLLSVVLMVALMLDGHVRRAEVLS